MCRTDWQPHLHVQSGLFTIREKCLCLYNAVHKSGLPVKAICVSWSLCRSLTKNTLVDAFFSCYIAKLILTQQYLDDFYCAVPGSLSNHTQTHTQHWHYTHTYTHRHWHTHTNIHTDTDTHTHTHWQTHTHTLTNTHWHTHTLTNTHTHTDKHTLTHTHTHWQTSLQIWHNLLSRPHDVSQDVTDNTRTVYAFTKTLWSSTNITYKFIYTQTNRYTKRPEFKLRQSADLS
jgi:hypothetical protein